VPADGEFRQRYLAENQRLGQQGLRVIAIARKDLDPAAFDPGADLLPLVTGLELLALVGIVDPPRPAARASIATAKKAGIRVRMITGDYAVTAAAVAGQLGIDGTVLAGAEFGAMSDEEALAEVDGIGVIARVTPEHKVRLVDVLRKKGQIVAMTGDGVNDAPAVKKADIGIAMGITGTEVTKEAAVMILTDDNFSTIVKAVELGRGLYDNLARYIRFFSIESKDERDSAFSLNTFSDKTFLITTSASFVLLILSTVLGIFQTVMTTTRLDVRQWLICTAVALSIVAAAEIRKAVLRQTAAKAIHPAGGPRPEPLPPNARRVPDMAEDAPVWEMPAAASRQPPAAIKDDLRGLAGSVLGEHARRHPLWMASAARH
jgi:magnesium-transporting ATPase (P-type)